MFHGIFDVPLWCCWVSAASFSQTEHNLTEVWNKSGHQGNYWNRAEVPLRQLRNFEVIFEGIRLRDVSGGAALDDLEYMDCAPSKWYAHRMDVVSSFGRGPMIGAKWRAHEQIWRGEWSNALQVLTSEENWLNKLDPLSLILPCSHQLEAWLTCDVKTPSSSG